MRAVSVDAAERFRELIEQHQRMVFSIALRMLGDTGAAEEVAQDVFLELHDALPRLSGEEHVRAWLRRVAVCRATDALRRRRTGGPVLVEEAWEDERYGGTVEAGVGWARGTEDGANRMRTGMSSRLEQMVASLPPAMQAAVVLRYGEEMKAEEIAAALGQPLPTVKSDLRRALELLRRKAEVMLKEYVRG